MTRSVPVVRAWRNVLSLKFVQEMRRLKHRIEEMNTQIYNPVGLNILWPHNVAFLFVRAFAASASLCLT